MLMAKPHTLSKAFFGGWLAARQDVLYLVEYASVTLHVVKPSETRACSMFKCMANNLSEALHLEKFATKTINLAENWA